MSATDHTLNQRSINKQIERLYRNVNIFNWYQPQQESPLNLGGKLSYNSHLTKTHFQMKDLAHSNVYADINNEGFRLYESKTAVQPSYLVQEPVTMELVKLSKALTTLLQSNDQELKVITYLSPPQQPKSAVVSRLLSDIKSAKAVHQPCFDRNDCFSDSALKQFDKEFAQKKFLIAKDSKKDQHKHKTKEFEMKPKHVTI